MMLPLKFLSKFFISFDGVKGERRRGDEKGVALIVLSFTSGAEIHIIINA